MKKLKCRKDRSWWKHLVLTACSIAACVPAMAQHVIPVVDFDTDTVGTQSSNPNIVHSTITDWTVVTDSVLDPAAPENVYESTQDQTNIKVEFPATTLAPGETLRVKVDYKYVAAPTSPGIQQYNFLRFGAYQTQGTATFTDDIGYLADVSYWQQGTGAKSGDYSIRREDNVWDDFDLGPLLDNQVSPVDFIPPAVPETGDIVTMFQPDGMMASWPKPFDDGITSDHAAVICVSNTGTAVEVCLYHGFPPTLIGKAVDTSATSILTFDTVYLESPSDNNGFHVDNIGIQHIAPELACCSGCVEFQDLTLGSVYNVGDTFTVHSADGSFGFDVVASDFFFSSGTAFSGGFAEVENGGQAGYFGQEMEVSNINLEFTPTGAPPMGVSVLFGEYGGNINLSVNGVAANVANFIDLDGLTLGGAMLSVPTGGLGNDTAELRMTGVPITQFIIGGQELWIDHICEYDEQIPPSDCPIDDYIAHDNGMPGGGEPDPVAAGWTYPNSVTEQATFLADLASLGISTDIITFEGSNGWSPVNGTGDMFAGTAAPYAGGPYTSAAFGTSGDMATGDATGNVSYNGADNIVTFTLFNNGHSAGIDEPGIGDMDGSNDSDRGINTSPGGFHFLEALPSENQPGGVAIEFDKAVPAVGMYVMGVEEDKRDIEVSILYADGSMQVRPADIVPGPLNDGGTQFLGYLAPDLQDSTCWIKRVTFNELYDGEPAGERDIFSIDDVIFAATESNPPITPSNCDLTFYDARDDGPANGGEPTPYATGWTFPTAQAEQTKFLADLTGLGLPHELITFEQANGWTPLTGTGDMFIEAGAPYAGGPYTTAAYGTSGSMGAGDANGSVDYLGADNTVSFTLFDNGHSVGIDEPGIGDMDTDNDTDRGVNTTSAGYHFLEALPSENNAGGLSISFQKPVPAAGMYVMGVEDGKRAITVTIDYADGSSQVRSTDITAGPNNEGGIQFLGYLAPDLQTSDCWIKGITFTELYSGEGANERDIFSIDDVIYVASEANPELDPEIPGDPNDPNNPDIPGDPQNNPNPQLVFGNPTPNLLNKGVASFPVAFENVSAVLLDLDDIKVLASGSVTFDPTLALNINATDHAVEVTITGGDGTVAIEVPTDVAFDAAGNAAPGGTSPTVAVDNTPPALSIGVPDIDLASRAIQWPLEYQGATEMNLVPGMITAVIGGTDLVTLAVNGGDSVNPSVRLESFPSGVTGDLVLTIAPGAAKDAANNTDAGGTQTLVITDLTFADKTNANDPDNVDLTNKLFALDGKLQDGYISGALVFFDENRNGQHDNGEPSTFTNNQGAFQLAIDLSQYDDNNNNVLDPSEGVLIMQGGVDISTGLAFEGQFLAPVGASLATPLSSLIVAIVDLNPTFTFAQAQTSIKQGLNLSGSVNINTYDPIASASQGDGASGQVFAAAAMVQDTVFTMTRILNTAGGGNQLGTIQAAGYRYIANRLMLNQAVNLTDADFLKTMIASLQQSLNIAVDATVVDAWANSIANSNQLKQKAADSNNPADAVKQIAKTQLVTQSQLTDDLANVQSGKVDADELQATYSGNGLENAVNQAPVGDVFANENRIGTFSFSKATYNQYEGPVASGGAQKISVDSITIKREDGNQQTVTLIVTPTDGTATTANGDFLANTVEVTFGDTEIYKTVSLANIIQDDAAAEGDETMNLQLTLKPGSPANAQLGAQTTATVNILDNDAAGTFAFANAQGNVIEGDEASRQIVIERTQGLSGQVVLDITAAALQGATAGSDFDNAATQVTFPAGTSKKVVLLPVIDDLVQAEPNETFQLTLAIGAGSAPGAALGAQNTFTATIVDNDVATQVNVTSSNPSVSQTQNGPVTVDLQYAGATSVNVRLSDITLIKTGTATGTLSMTGGTTATPKVTVSNITGDGTLAIQVAAGRGVDALGNGDTGVTSSTFTVDNTGPAITIGNPSASVTLNGPVSFQVTYADDAFAVNLKASHVTIEGGLNVKADIQIANATTRNPTVTLSNISGMWSPNIRINGGSSQDILGNQDQGAVSAGFDILSEAPTLSVGFPSSIATREGPVTIPLSYQGVSQVALSPDNVELIQTGSATGTVSVEDGNTSTPRIIISGIGGTGTLAVRVKSGSGQNQLGITDAGGESRSIQIDNSAPVMSVSTPTTLTNGSEAVVDVRYDGAYLIVLREEFIALQYDGAVTAEFELLEMNASTRRVRLFNIQGNGAIRVNVAPGKALSRTGIHESQGGSSEWIRIDQTAPTLVFFNVQEVTVNGGTLIYGVQYQGADNINLSNDHIRLITTGNTQASATVQTVPGNTNQRQIVVNNIQGDGTLQVEVSAGSASDQAGNVDQTVLLSPVATIDQTGPTVAVGDPSSLTTQGEAISIPLTVQGGNFSELSAGHIQLVLSGDSLKAGINIEQTSDTEAVITLSGFEGEGTISLGVTAGAAKDAAGNESGDIAATWSIQVTQPAPKAEPGKLGIQGSTLSLFGTEGVVYLLEVTTNFVDWELVSELKATGNETALTFDLDISSGAGFYRVRTVEP